MTERVQKLLDNVLTLTPAEQDELLSELLARLDGEPDSDAETAWAKEIERRARRALSGESKGLPWEKVKAELEQRFRRA
jgi:putative addiction module component (TIGR02574 family)